MIDFSNTRAASLDRLEAFSTDPVSRYASRRNHAGPGEQTTSLLGPAIARRLITEREVVRAVLARHPFARVEKFVQEVLWRRYWKSWLELRPELWRRYREEVADGWDCGVAKRIAEIENGNSGVAVMDAFVRQLRGRGWLHNHVRMWFAAWWVHREGLPWQAGAEFFLRHLLDGDAASNTLSWRWVAGLQTPGKTYLARPENLEKFLDAEWLAEHREGWEKIKAEQPRVAREAVAEIREIERGAAWPQEDGRSVLWVHDEDLSVERHAGRLPKPSAVMVAGAASVGRDFRYGPAKEEWLRGALVDAADRAKSFGCPVEFREGEDAARLGEMLAGIAREASCSQVIAMRPLTGPLADMLPQVKAVLDRDGIDLRLLDDPEDTPWTGLARSGFFPFWNKAKNQLEDWLK